MDLGTIREQLQCDNYDSPREFARDVRLVFSNSKLYNTNKKSRVSTEQTLTRVLSTFGDDIFASLQGVCHDPASLCHV